ncbi:translocator protein, LysE family [Synechococcus sp. PCC 7335]|uniref:LysE family translocator n=1 Tax=Synechococcus sp. (strain ATCC 29403 / PCC 7335) TaxID=91464 RepID=UPI00017ED572|nr:LysE family transporter [Synechococcus sp. PCC 7335]EDX87318.1 translocator protein, LysE family [Synechococcus sp. PCC 7335]
MLIFVLLRGIAMGLAIAAPVGPIALLCIRRTIDKGRLVGVLSGLGAATADGLYGMVAAFGLTAVSEFLVGYSNWLRIGGGLFLCYLGLTTFLSRGSTQPLSSSTSNLDESSLLISPASSPSLFSAYTTTLALTLTNPATILSFVAIFAGLGITQSAYLDSVTLVFGVFTGSILWWLVLVSGVAYLRDRLTPERLFRFNRFSSRVFGLLIIGFGVVALVSAI